MKRIKFQNNGMAMTEVLVAFLMLLLSLAMLVNCITLASNLMTKAHDIDKSFEEFEKQIVEGNYTSTPGTVTYTFSYNGSSTGTISANTNQLTSLDGKYHINVFVS
jgi:hypothetical protein